MLSDSAGRGGESLLECPPLLARLTANRWALLGVFLTVAAALSIFTLSTVNNRTAVELSESNLTRFTQVTISYWAEHGFFRSGGIIIGDPPPKFRYRGKNANGTSTGAYLFDTYALQYLWTSRSGGYSWRLTALHNTAIIALTAALIGLLVARVLLRMAVYPLWSIVLGLSAEAVFFTFPAVLYDYWQLSEHLLAVLAGTLFLLCEERMVDGSAPKLVRWLQILAVFMLAYIEYVAGIFLLATFLALQFLDRSSGYNWRRVRDILIPVCAAAALFWVQLTWVRFFVKAWLGRSLFMYRSGLDGSNVYYGDHSDILFARNIARMNFPLNRDLLFHWPALFVAGCVAFLVLALMCVRDRRLRFAFTASGSLLGSYVLYAAVFSQAIVIHPYLYDVLIVAPLVMALFGILPGLLEQRSGDSGVFVTFALFVAIWYSMVQLRDYALWVPLPKAPVVEQPKEGSPAGQAVRTVPSSINH
jgi:hypothetical protein